MPKATKLRTFTCDVFGCHKSFKSDGDLRRHKKQAKNHDVLPPPAAPPEPAMPLDAPPQVDPMPNHVPSIASQMEDYDMDGLSPERVLEEYGVDVDADRDPEDSHRQHLEELEEDDTVIDKYPRAGEVKRIDAPPHTALDALAAASGKEHWPFETKHDLLFARWILSEAVSDAALDRLLKETEISSRLGLSFSNARALKVPGLQQKLHVLHRDTAECLKILWARINLHTANHMWRVQCEIPNGGTVVSVIFFVDKTQLCQIVGVEDNKAYPIYMTLANIAMDVRRNISSGAYILVGYLPTASFADSDLSDTIIRNLRLQVFHAAVRAVFAPLREASHAGLELVSADGAVRMGYPVLAIGGLDYPEQCQHTLARYGWTCPKCAAKKAQFSLNMEFPMRDPKETLRLLREASKLNSVTAVNDFLKPHGLNYVLQPYWEGWKHVNIFEAIAPDILHQLYQGMLKHLVKWLAKVIGEDELDARLQRLSPAFGLRHFDHGISTLQRLSGKEHKAIAAQLLVCVASADVDKRVVKATRALLDFIHIAQYSCHSDDTLDDLQQALNEFYENAVVFIELGACESLDLPKMHGLQHYVSGIQLFGDANAYNTEIGERLHIDFTKNAYEATNKKKDQYLRQMCRWNDSRQRMDSHSHWYAHKTNTTFDPRKRRADTRNHDAIEYAKKPSGGHRSFDELASGHHATGLQSALQIYLDEYCYEQWTQRYPQLPVPDFPRIRSSMMFPVWYKMKFWTPDLQTLGAKDTRDVAFATPRRSRSDGDDSDYEDEDNALSARFSPVFIKKDEVAGQGGTQGLRIAHLRVIFALPDALLAKLAQIGLDDPGMLVFVQWFTRLGRRQPDSRMFKVARETTFVPGSGAARERSVSVVSANDIRRSCHLAVRLDRNTSSIPRHLTSENVLEEWEGEFWVNHWVDKPMYRSLL